MPKKTHSLRITYASTTDDLAKLIGGNISQMYCESGGKMGYKIYNLNKHVSEINKEKETLKLVFSDGSSEVVRQAMVVYTKEEQVVESKEEDVSD